MNDDWNIPKRIKNIVWTISEDYKDNIKLNNSLDEDSIKNIDIYEPNVLHIHGMTNKEAEWINIYSAAHQGAHIKHTNVKVLNSYIASRLRIGFDPDILLPLLEIAEDYRIDWLISKERPGYKYIKDIGLSAFLRQFYAASDDSEYIFRLVRVYLNEIDMEVLSNSHSDLQAINNMAQELSIQLKKCRDASSTSDILNIVDSIYMKWWGNRSHKYINVSNPSDESGEGDNECDGDCDDDAQKGEENNNNKTSVEDSSDSTDTLIYDDNNKNKSGSLSSSSNSNMKMNDENSSMLSNAFSSSTDEELEKEIQKQLNRMMRANFFDNFLDKDRLSELKKQNKEAINNTSSSLEPYEDNIEIERMEYYYGKSLLNTNELYIMQNSICKECHAGYKLHWTEGALRANDDNEYQKNMMERHKKINLSIYEKNKLINEQHIRKLSQMLMDTLSSAKDPDAYEGDSGAVIPNKIWKALKTNNNKVFHHVDFTDPGDYVVDILLDASGSQSDRQPLIAKQGFILAEALSICSIPIRVSSFCNFSNYTIMRRFRNYEDIRSSNMNIFEYMASGNNRDGLAIQAAAFELSKRHENNKILIVLSDGQPSDTAMSSNGAKSYGDIAGIEDTAKQIRRVRANNIIVLGVYTGPKANLEAEKLMYGKDFAYIHDINYFADIVGKYLKKHIEDIMY